MTMLTTVVLSGAGAVARHLRRRLSSGDVTACIRVLDAGGAALVVMTVGRGHDAAGPRLQGAPPALAPVPSWW
jgi:hypothetical protein